MYLVHLWWFHGTKDHLGEKRRQQHSGNLWDLSLAIAKARQLKRSRLQGITVPESEVCEENALEASADATSGTAPYVVKPVNKTFDTLSDPIKDHCNLAAHQKKDPLEMDTDDQANLTAQQKKVPELQENHSDQLEKDTDDQANYTAQQKKDAEDNEVKANLAAQQKNEAEEVTLLQSQTR